jgi:hypothetical protein
MIPARRATRSRPDRFETAMPPRHGGPFLGGSAEPHASGAFAQTLRKPRTLPREVAGS